MLKYQFFLVAFMTLLAHWLVEARLHLNTISLLTFRRDGCWTFVDRFHVDPGHMSVVSSIKLILNGAKQGSAYHLQLVAIPESIWHKSLEVKCNQQGLDNEQLQLKRTKEIIYDFHLNEGNSYSAHVSSKLQVPVEQTYHFILRDCSKALINDGYSRETKINISVDMRNNESVVSAGEDKYGWLLPLLIVTGVALLWFLHKEKEEEGDNWIKLLVKISLWIGIASIAFKYAGYLLYLHATGVQHGFFDFMYLLLHSTSDSILLVLIMLLSFGWTVTFNNARDFDLYVPLACMLGFVHIIMTMLNKIADGEHDKYHMFDSIPAYIMLTFRTIGLITFLVGIGKSWIGLDKTKHPQKIKQYLYHVTTIGFVYMTFVPIGFVAIRYVSNRHKKETMFFAMELTRFALTIWLALLAGRKNSVYRSIIDGSFMEKAQKFY